MIPQRNDPGRDAASSHDGGGDDCAQRLSCLLDGELAADDCRALVERLRHDEDACRQWVLLNCVGDAIRSADVASWHAESFVSRVSAALENEPTVLAPAALPARPAIRRWLLPGAGVAAAAIVLFAVGLPSRQGGSSDSTTATAPAPAAVVAAGGIDRSPALERYLAAHRELAEPALMPNSTPYVRTSGAMLPQEGR